MLTSKQRAHLAGLATKLDPIVYLGKAGAATGVSEALERALVDHELVKLRFIDFKGERNELARQLATQSGAELIRVIGNVGVFFRQQPDPKKRKIEI
ncbi:MAG: RNA-binding protein [Spirochaetes bacterium RIFOXYC1_FULL_54_7]|nr:MAG: RNA-binding protein [Spirochaetes bacterium RIFOXYC1_FULL_54_7]